VSTPADVRQELVETIRRFVEREVVPVASTLEHKNEYPHRLAERMNELGLFGATIPTEFGGLGLDFTTYAMIIEELCVGWMSLSGILNTHLLLGYIIRIHGTEAQKQRYLPKLARGEFRGALCLTEAHAGSDVQRIRTTARRRGDMYVVNGTKMFVTNGPVADLFLVLARTGEGSPLGALSAFLVPRSAAGLTVGPDIEKSALPGAKLSTLHLDDVILSYTGTPTAAPPLCATWFSTLPWRPRIVTIVPSSRNWSATRIA